MSKHRSRLGSGRSTGVAFLVVSAFVGSALGCGKSTRLGDARTTEAGGSGGEAVDGGNALGNAGQGGDSGSASGGSVGQGGEVGSGASGSAGTNVGDAGQASCKLPRPTPKANPTEEETSRAELIHDFCQNLGDQRCLDGGSFGDNDATVSGQARGCSASDRVIACEQDLALGHYSVPAECEAEWQALIRCGAGASYSAEQCMSLSQDGRLPPVPPELQGPCKTEGAAYDACLLSQPDPEVITGSRATCRYSAQGASACRVYCDAGSNDFWSECSGPEGLPQECVCGVNNHYLWDTYAMRYQFYVSDCRDAAQTMADGECVNRLDCCFTYAGGSGNEGCGCTSDPGALGFETCEALARESGGKVVPICPQYKLDPGCWPPSESCP